MLQKKFVIFTAFLILCGLLSISLEAREHGMTVENLLDTYRQNYERSIDNIDDFVVVNDFSTIYYLKTFENGRPYFKTKMEMEHSDASVFGGVTENDLFSPEMYEMLKKDGVYEGVESLNGFRVHIISSENLEGFLQEGEEDSDVTVKQARFYIDADQWVMREVRMEVENIEDGEVQIIHPTIKMEDYRNFEGMLIPFRTVIQIAGMGMDLSEEERQEAIKNLEELDRQLAQMQPEERAMMERMMGPAREAYRGMLESDVLEISVNISEVRINTGLQEDFFQDAE